MWTQVMRIKKTNNIFVSLQKIVLTLYICKVLGTPQWYPGNVLRVPCLFSQVQLLSQLNKLRQKDQSPVLLDQLRAGGLQRAITLCCKDAMRAK